MILNISDQDIQVIQNALLEMKLKDSFITFTNLRQQIESLNKPLEAPKDE